MALGGRLFSGKQEELMVAYRALCGQTVVKLSTGEHKRRIEMVEHVRRVEALRRFGFDVSTRMQHYWCGRTNPLPYPG